MKLHIWMLFVCLSLFSCKDVETGRNNELAQVIEYQHSYKSYGKNITAENALSSAEMSEKYNALELGDTIKAKFKTTVNSVCKMKGCWMVLDLPDAVDNPTVRFKDYGFFVPKDIEAKIVVVEGLAFMEEIGVEDQRHLAGDAGKTEDEINAIQEPRLSPGFLADGVLIKE
jgi:hypothetical protein